MRGPLWGQPSPKWGYFGHALKAFTEYPTLWISYLHILEPYLPNQFFLESNKIYWFWWGHFGRLLIFIPQITLKYQILFRIDLTRLFYAFSIKFGSRNTLEMGVQNNPTYFVKGQFI